MSYVQVKATALVPDRELILVTLRPSFIRNVECILHVPALGILDNVQTAILDDAAAKT
jgi:hypothetical protein